MKHSSYILFWTPRILVIWFAAFSSLFALDVFEENRTLWDTIMALLIHLIPTAIILVSLVIAWRRELFGAIFYFALGIFYIAWAWGNFHISAYFGISGPLFIVGILFFVSWYYQRRGKKTAE
ncbi:MAG: hypothetical protein H8E34_09090 [Bacteroidetes bacterium]|nr:hypothetical protein [Bacteroidota bacterium]MBL6943933.1 hypothetical protein [Bacteroidales bacterium]